MFITNITLQNYHQFEDLVLDLTYPKNHQKAGQPLSKICFIGPNGVGKSTIMEFVMKYCNDSKITNEVKMLAIPEKIFYMPDTIAHTPKFDGVGVEVVKIGEDTQNLSKLVGSLEQEYTQSIKLHNKFPDLIEPIDPISPMFEWFIAKMSNLNFRYAYFEDNQIYFRINDTKKFIPITKLSSGTRQLMAKLLPLRHQNPSNSLIFIDQPEDALFPSLQKQIVSFYSSIGQNNQLFVATHSPLIASQFEPCEIFALDFKNDKIILRKRPSGSEGWGVDKFLYHWFGVKTESDSYLTLKNRFFALLAQEDHSEYDLLEINELKNNPILQDLF